MSVINAVDLFCGAGGTSYGLKAACELAGRKLNLTAINHWDRAVETHAANHPDANHLCASVDEIDPWKVVPGGKLDVLVASPECTHHSIARGGKPHCDQSRASAWHVLRWAEALQPHSILIENVPEFISWGPLGVDGKPLKSRKGATFIAFLMALESLGYRVDHRVLCAADYGDPTTRRRLFIQARKGRRPVVWPEPTHTEKPESGMFQRDLKPWRAAREIIDWTLKGQSIFSRKRPLQPATLKRIAAGLEKFGGEHAEPFLLTLTHGGRVRSLNRPMPTVTGAHNGEHALIEPFVLGQQSCSAARSVSQPIPTVSTAGAISLIEPFLLKYYGSGQGVESVKNPLGTVTTKDRFGVVTPMAYDILFRMLQPHELAGAMGLDGYKFTGTKTEVVKQIGNAVPFHTARALAGMLVA